MPYQCWLLSLAAASLAASALDPRHFFDPRCPPAALPDPEGSIRFAPSRAFLAMPLPATATLADCATACCGDWNCVAFALQPALPPGGPLSGAWLNHDSLRGTSPLTLRQTGAQLQCTSLDPSAAYWSTAEGVLAPDGVHLYLVFDGSPRNNRSGVISDGGTTITLSRLPFDPANFTQVFALVNHTNTSTPPQCTFMDELPPLTPRPASSSMLTGSRAFLPPPLAPPYPASTYISAALDSSALLGVNGDEFPTTWASDGFSYSGAGDNIQPSPSIPLHYSSPASFFKISASSPLDARYPNSSFTLQGGPFPLSDSALAKAMCPGWGRGLANIKSSGVIEFEGSMFWAVSCFNYGDDPTFNRQRYGPAWIAASTDWGVNWTSVPQQVFAGRLAAPRLVQAGQGYAGAPDPDHIYALFPGTTNNASFFECNDAAWLGRARKNATTLPFKSAWEFFVGVDSDGSALYDSDDSLAAPVLDWPLHTSVQQVNWHASLQRFILANWVWISMDGYPRPDHSPDERNGRTARQRTWLTLLEAPTLHGPWKVFFSNDQWQYSDGSSGAYTPIFPAAWINATDESFWMVSTQCCTGANSFPPDNHYSFNAQRVSVTRR